MTKSQKDRFLEDALRREEEILKRLPIGDPYRRIAQENINLYLEDAATEERKEQIGKGE